MKYLAIIEQTNTGYCGYIADFDTAIVAAFPTFEKVKTALSEGLSIYGREVALPIPKISKLEEVPDLENSEEVIAVWLEPAPQNPVSLEIAQVMKAQNLRPVDLARRLGVSRANVVRIVDPFYFGHSLALLARVAEALGARLELPRLVMGK